MAPGAPAPTTRVRLAIIGSGPAGLTAAIYASRANLAPLLVSGVPAGGQLMLTSDVENYPGFPEGILGPELMEKFREQASKFGTVFRDAAVRSVDFQRRPFRIDLGSSGTVLADCVIVATGANARWLDLPSEQRLRGHGVSACATCDGFFFKGVELAVVGGGDSAMEEALFLTKFATKVTILHRRAEFRASPIMLERARHHPRIAFRPDTIVEEVLGDAKVEGLRIRHVPTGRVETLPVGGLFLAIGHDPATAPFRAQIEVDEKGYVRTQDLTRTSVDGVFAAGDVHDHRYRQAVTAAGFGCMAALDAERWLADHPAEGDAVSSAARPAMATPSQGRA